MRPNHHLIIFVLLAALAAPASPTHAGGIVRAQGPHRDIGAVERLPFRVGYEGYCQSIDHAASAFVIQWKSID